MLTYSLKDKFSRSQLVAVCAYPLYSGCLSDTQAPLDRSTTPLLVTSDIVSKSECSGRQERGVVWHRWVGPNDSGASVVLLKLLVLRRGGQLRLILQVANQLVELHTPDQEISLIHFANLQLNQTHLGAHLHVWLRVEASLCSPAE